MKYKKLIKIIAAAIIAFALAFLLLFANSFFGNPVSRALASRSAKSYVAQNYAELDLLLSKASYNFKIGDYYVRAQSTTSIDTHFTLSYNSWGKLTDDNYKHRVLGLENTRDRVAELYREQVDAVIEADGFPHRGYITFGDLYGVPNEKLELDKEYDVMELGKAHGNLILYIEDEAISAQRAAKILLDIRQLLDEAGIGFATVDFELIKPRMNNQPNPDSARFGVAKFAYDDIHKDGLIERLTAAADVLNKYYAEQDALKGAEIVQAG